MITALRQHASRCPAHHCSNPQSPLALLSDPADRERQRARIVRNFHVRVINEEVAVEMLQRKRQFVGTLLDGQSHRLFQSHARRPRNRSCRYRHTRCSAAPPQVMRAALHTWRQALHTIGLQTPHQRIDSLPSSNRAGLDHSATGHKTWRRCLPGYPGETSWSGQ